MSDAVAEYARHRLAPDAWALGRFVVPFPRWNDLMSSADSVVGANDSWPVSLLASAHDVQRIRELAEHSTELRVESVEVKATSAADVEGVGPLVESGVPVFVEPVPLSAFTALAPALARAGAGAKIRTGGVTADAFPSPEQVLAFLRVCRETRLRFKATAGLHHAIRGEYRLTYEPSPPSGEMFGFLNIAVGAALLWSGHAESDVLGALTERVMEAFRFSDEGLQWRSLRLSAGQLATAHHEFFAGFGSCSFQEPMAELGLEAVPRG